MRSTRGNSRKKALMKLLYIQRPTRLRKPTNKKRKKILNIDKLSMRFNRIAGKIITFRFLLYCIGFVLVGAVIGIVFFSSFFYLSDIRVKRDVLYVNSQNIENFMAPLRNKNIFFLSESSIEDQIEKNFPVVQAVTVTKIYPRSLEVKVKGNPIFARIKYRGEQKEFLLTETGVVIQTETNSDAPHTDYMLMEIPKYRDFQPDEQKAIAPLVTLETDKQLFSESEMKNMKSLLSLLHASFPEIHIASLQYLPLEQEMYLVLDQGTRLIFVMNEDLVTQVYKLKKDETNIPLVTGELSYVDLGITDQVVLCRKGEKCEKWVK